MKNLRIENVLGNWLAALELLKKSEFLYPRTYIKDINIRDFEFLSAFYLILP
jgi:hypothetical protein